MRKFIQIFSVLLFIYSCSNDSTAPLDDDIDIVDPDPIPDPVVTAPCVNGMAGSFPCNGYDLVKQLTLSDLRGGSTFGNDSWGWTDPTNQKEYALMATNSAVIFIDISDPLEPFIVGHLPTATSNSTWRDVKTYGNYAFVVSEASGHGMQVFDLTRLRGVTTRQTFTADAHYTGFGNAHNIVINETNGYAYAVGSNTFSGGPHFVDISNPLNPTAAGGYANDAYSHDAQVVTYNGPDTDYTGREIYIGSNENEVVIVDVTDKNNPTRISTVNYTDIGYTHQGWFTEDMSYFLLGDELDEKNLGYNTRTIVFDFRDLDNPTFHMSYLGQTFAIDHNGYVKGNLFFQANYSEGVRIIDISSIGGGVMTEVGFFDTMPGSSASSFDGVWNVYPYFPSGNIILSDTQGGFFIIRKSQ